MNANFERYHRELGPAKIDAFAALCFHRAGEIAEPCSALMRAPLLADEATAKALVERVFDAANGDFDKERLADALAVALEGPGCMPGLISLRGLTGKYYAFERNIYDERGEPFTLDELLAPVFYGLSSDPEFYFENVRGSETAVLFNCFHVTKLGLEFCAWLFPERMEKLRKTKEGRARSSP